MSVDQTHLDMLNKIDEVGVAVTARNSTTKRLTNLSATFCQTPLVSIRKTAWKNCLREMEWFMSGSDNINDLHPSVVPWWVPWADIHGVIKNNYSIQFRYFAGQNGRIVDQIEYLMDAIKNDPFSRRMVITTWNTADMIDASIPITSCHGTVIQAFVHPATDSLDLTMYQRSADMMLGVPHNWLQYWGFMLYLAKQCGRNPGSLTWLGGDCHLYPDHEPLLDEMNVAWTNKDSDSETPFLIYRGNIGDPFRADDFELDIPYKPIVTKKANMTV